MPLLTLAVCLNFLRPSTAVSSDVVAHIMLKTHYYPLTLSQHKCASIKSFSIFKFLASQSWRVQEIMEEEEFFYQQWKTILYHMKEEKKSLKCMVLWCSSNTSGWSFLRSNKIEYTLEFHHTLPLACTMQPPHKLLPLLRRQLLPPLPFL